MTAGAISPLDMTGSWQGLFSWPGRDEPVAFLASVTETAGQISGVMQELGLIADPACEMLVAMLEGERHGSMVHFVKTYDGTGGVTHVVEHQGALTKDGSQMTGDWLIHRVAVGRFLMTRVAEGANDA
jgi:hypothetical protein